MSQKIVILASAITLVSGVLACSSGGTGTTGTGAGGATASSTADGTGGSGGDATPAESCAKPGDKGNDKGVGTYCSPQGMQCASLDYATACLADLGQNQWFCTKISCKADAECGTDATCHMDPQGSACVPKKCDATGAGGAGGSSATATGSGGAGGK